MIDSINIILGAGIIVLNLVPILVGKSKYFGITIPLSLLLAAIRVLFVPQ